MMCRISPLGIAVSARRKAVRSRLVTVSLRPMYFLSRGAAGAIMWFICAAGSCSLVDTAAIFVEMALMHTNCSGGFSYTQNRRGYLHKEERPSPANLAHTTEKL